MSTLIQDLTKDIYTQPLLTTPDASAIYLNLFDNRVVPSVNACMNVSKLITNFIFTPKCITSALINDQSILNTHIANGAVYGSHIQGKQITTLHLSDTAGITGAQMAGQTITSYNIQDKSLSFFKFEDKAKQIFLSLRCTPFYDLANHKIIQNGNSQPIGVANTTNFFQSGTVQSTSNLFLGAGSCLLKPSFDLVQDLTSSTSTTLAFDTTKQIINSSTNGCMGMHY